MIHANFLRSMLVLALIAPALASARDITDNSEKYLLMKALYEMSQPDVSGKLVTTDFIANKEFTCEFTRDGYEYFVTLRADKYPNFNPNQYLNYLAIFPHPNRWELDMSIADGQPILTINSYRKGFDEGSKGAIIKVTTNPEQTRILSIEFTSYRGQWVNKGTLTDPKPVIEAKPVETFSCQVAQ